MSDPVHVAIDIDLGRVTIVHSTAGVLAHGADPLGGGVCALGEGSPRPDLVLIEVAGPILHHEESHSYRRWMVYNSMMAAMLNAIFENADIPVLVAASTAWTEGYTEPERHAIAGILPLKHKLVKGKKVPIYKEAHDCRECRAMLYFYARAPKHWVPLEQYMASLCGK